MLQVILGIFALCMNIQVSQAQFAPNQLAGKYWLYIKDADMKTEEYFEIRPEGSSYSLTWPDKSICKLIPDASTAYHLECHEEKMKIIFEETADKRIKGFTIELAGSKMYGLKE